MPPEVIAFDPYLLEFIKNNFITITAFLALLKRLAAITPSTTDDKITTLFVNIFSTLTPHRKEKTWTTGKVKKYYKP